MFKIVVFLALLSITLAYSKPAGDQEANEATLLKFGALKSDGRTIQERHSIEAANVKLTFYTDSATCKGKKKTKMSCDGVCRNRTAQFQSLDISGLDGASSVAFATFSESSCSGADQFADAQYNGCYPLVGVTAVKSFICGVEANVYPITTRP